MATDGPGEEEELPTRSFGWWDMFVHPDEDPRADGGFTGERETLVGFLRDQRFTFELKCSGLDAAGMARRSVLPSNMSLLGLVRHLAGVAQHWIRRQMAGLDPPGLYEPGDDFNAAVPDPQFVADAWTMWRNEVAFTEQYVAAAPDLEVVGKDGEVLREVLVHLIEEYARHNGHADFLRERIDGRVGQ
jgi:hypothetical protein